MSRVEIDSLRAEKMIKDITKRIFRPEVMHMTVAQKMWKEQLNHFSRSQGPDGSWPPLAPSTLKQKARLRYTSQPLIRTGHLKNSMKAGVDKDGPYVESRTKYGNYHQSDAPRSKLPQRKFLWLSDSWINQALQRYAEFYVDGKR